MNSLKTIGLLFLLTAFCLPAGAQTYLYASGHYGRMLKIKTDWPEIYRNASAFEAGFSARTSGKKIWHGLYGFPETGFRFVFFFPGNPEVFGYAFSLSPTLSFPIAQRRAFQLRFNYDYSLGIITRPWNRTANPENNVIGSPVNNFVRFQLESRWQVSDYWQITLGTAYSHFSNARTKVPNLGINIPSVSLGAGFQIKKTYDHVIENRQIPAPGFGKLHLSVAFGYGINSQKSPGGPLYPVYSGEVAIHTIRNHKIRLAAGVKYFFVESLYAFILNQDIPFENPGKAATGLIVYSGGEFLMGHWAIVAHFGPYVKKPYQMNYLLYTRFGTRWYLYDQQENSRFQPFAGVYVHAHSGEADFAEFSLGFLF
ncbi:MAG: acyloxyacyl hydrolase [Bacteroidia bacterium]